MKTCLYWQLDKNYLLRIGSSVIQDKRIQVKRTLVKAWVRFIEKSCIYLFTISYLAIIELRPQFRRITAPFITNWTFKLPNQVTVDHHLLLDTIVSHRLLLDNIEYHCLFLDNIGYYYLLLDNIIFYHLLCCETVDHVDYFL